MKTVFQALQENKGANIDRINPVRVAAKYPAKQTASGKWMRNIQIQDDSGKATVTVWGEAANSTMPDGQTVQLSSPLKVDEYNGTKKFVANSFDWGGSSGTTTSNTSSAPAPNAPSAAPKMDGHEMAITMARFTNSYLVALIEEGMDKDFAERCAVMAPQFAAQWFFGEKSPSFPEESGEA